MTSLPPPSPFLSQFLSSTFHIPPSPQTHPHRSERRLLSNRDPLSIPTTTAHFRRFVAKIGPVFWLQDRIEEIVLWKTGWKPTTLWMAIYFLAELDAMHAEATREDGDEAPVLASEPVLRKLGRAHVRTW